jgi:hypothetical protein
MHVYTLLRILAFEVRRCEFVCFAERSDNSGASSHAKEAKQAKEATAKEANNISTRSQQPKQQVKDDGILPPGNNV